jgi:predicted O-methyltransferase YrrM
MVEAIAIEQLGIEPTEPRRGAKKQESGMNARDIPVFCGIVRRLAPRRALEIGTWWGLSADMIREMAPECEVITVDHRDHKPERPAALGSPDESIRYIIGDSKTVQLPRDWYGATDFVFIDGDHRRNGVVSDTRLALSMVSPGGLIVWHDLLVPGGKHDQLKGLSSKHKYYVTEFLHYGSALPVYRIEGTFLGIYRHPVDGVAELPQ